MARISGEVAALSEEYEAVNAEYEPWVTDEVAQDTQSWLDMSMEPLRTALSLRAHCQPCDKLYDNAAGLRAHEQRNHRDPPEEAVEAAEVDMEVEGEEEGM